MAGTRARKEVRDVKRKKWLILLAAIALFSPLSAFAADTDDSIGIGFKEEQPTEPDPKEPDPKDPTPKDPEPIYVPIATGDSKGNTIIINNVIPLTLGSEKNRSVRAKSFPKTGEVLQTEMRFTGFLCVACSFWLFLFTRLREEEDDEEKV